MKITIEFCKMYDPGELSQMQFKTEYEKRLFYHEENFILPNFKDRITFNGNEYFILEVKHICNNKTDIWAEVEIIKIKAVRKIMNYSEF